MGQRLGTHNDSELGELYDVDLTQPDIWRIWQLPI